MSVTATLIARDEGHRIARCLESLRWVDELVVVVDAATSDDTAEVARRFTPHVHVRPFTSFSDQRAWTDAQATGEWILSVDCDELVTEALRTEIQSTLAAPRHDAYRIPHLDYMFGKWIRHGGWFPQYHVRLYRRGSAAWQRDIHEKVAVTGTLGTLVQPLLHYSHGRVSDWVNKMARYTTTEAEAMHRAGRRVGLGRALVEPFLYAGYKFVWQQGWRDGAHGLVLAVLLGVYRLLVYLKAWDLGQAAAGPRERDDCPPPISRS